MKRQNDTLRLLRDFRGYLWLAGSLLFALLRTVRDLLCMIATADVTNAVMTGERVWSALGFLIFAMFINVPLTAASSYIDESYMAHIQRAGMRRIGEKLPRLPLRWLADQKSGDIVATSTGDLDKLAEWVQWCLPQTFRQILYIIGALLYCLSQNVALTAFVFPVVILLVPLLSRLTSPLKEISGRQRKAAAASLAQTQEVLDDPEFIKAYSLEDRMEQRVGRSLDEQMAAERKGAVYLGITKGVGILSSYLPGFISAAAGIFFLLQGQVTPGFLVSFVQITVQRFSGTFSQFAFLISRAKQAAASSKRLCKLLYAEEERTDGEKSVPAGDAPVFEAKDVHFGYGEQDVVLDGVTIKVNQGETVALVGASGGGKSTLLGLLMGVYHPTGGKISCMGRPIEAWNPAALQDLMAPVFQDAFLFPATIQENIAGVDSGHIGGKEAERVRQALENAGLSDFIKGLPNGAETPVSEHGTSLSGGQRQRMTIARAFYKDAPILLFDEPTSALDTVTEDQFQSVYRKLKAGRTTVVVAHRLKTIREADRIYVLEKGKVVQEGTHEELIAKEGAYRRLYEAQANSREVAVNG